MPVPAGKDCKLSSRIMGLKTLSRLSFDNGSEFAKLSMIQGPEIYFLIRASMETWY